jgi:twitching motility protein PilT
MDLGELLQFTKLSGASDLYLSAGAPLMVRLHGDVKPLQAPGVPPEGPAPDEVRRMLYDVLGDTQRKQLEEHFELDLSLSLSGVGRFRANAFFHDRGVGAVFRVIPDSIPTFAQLGLPEVLRTLVEKPNGLVLVTGPTGSGKSTTLAAMLDVVNEELPGHVITVEDPIEFVHRPKRCMVHQRELGPNTKSFGNALRSALREDPDVILVGELRDLDTITLALTAAETGHLVLGTLHTVSAAKSVDRIVSVFPEGEQAQVRTMLAGSLQGIVAQILLPRADKPGRVAAHEICVATPAVRALVRDDKVHQIATAIQTGARVGMQTLSASIARLVAEGKVAKKVAEEAQLEYVGSVDLQAGAPPPSAAGAPASSGMGGLSSPGLTGTRLGPVPSPAVAGATTSSRRYV